MKCTLTLLLTTLALSNANLLEMSQTLWSKFLNGGLTSIGSLDPLRIPIVKVDQAHGRTTYRMILSNVAITGLNSSTLESIHIARGSVKSNSTEKEAGFISYTDKNVLDSIRYRFHTVVKDPRMTENRDTESIEKFDESPDRQAQNYRSSYSGKYREENFKSDDRRSDRYVENQQNQQKQQERYESQGRSSQDQRRFNDQQGQEFSQNRQGSNRNSEPNYRQEDRNFRGENRNYQQQNRPENRNYENRNRQENRPEGRDFVMKNREFNVQENRNYREENRPENRNRQENREFNEQGNRNYQQPNRPENRNYETKNRKENSNQPNYRQENRDYSKEENRNYRAQSRQNDRSENRNYETKNRQENRADHRQQNRNYEIRESQNREFAPNNGDQTERGGSARITSAQSQMSLENQRRSGNNDRERTVDNRYRNDDRQPAISVRYTSDRNEENTDRNRYENGRQKSMNDRYRNDHGDRFDGRFTNGREETVDVKVNPQMRQNLNNRENRLRFSASSNPCNYEGPKRVSRLEDQPGFVDIVYADERDKKMRHFGNLRVEKENITSVYSLEDMLKDLQDGRRFIVHNFTEGESLSKKNDAVRSALETKRIRDLLRYARDFQENEGYYEEGMVVNYHFGNQNNTKDVRRSKREHAVEQIKEEDIIHIIMKIRIPLLSLKATYNLMGKVGDQVLRGNGQFSGDFTEMIGQFTIELKKTGNSSLTVRATRAKLEAKNQNVNLQGMNENGPVKEILTQGLMAAEAVAAMLVDDLTTKVLSETASDAMIYKMYKQLPEN